MKYFTPEGRYNSTLADPVAERVRRGLLDLIEREPMESLRELELVIQHEVNDMILSRVLTWNKE